MMLDRRACERRVYRLAALLSGNPLAAAKVIQAVLDAQPDLGTLESARMDRLTVLRAREIEPGSIVNDRVPRIVADALADMTAQQREAWVFVHVYRMPMREAARAMDCSVTAMTQHVTLANQSMSAALEHDDDGISPDAAADALRAWVMTIDVPAFVRREQRRRRRLRMALVLVGAVVALAAVVGVLAILDQWNAADAGSAPPG